jgi:hypothetical protein
MRAGAMVQMDLGAGILFCGDGVVEIDLDYQQAKVRLLR